MTFAGHIVIIGGGPTGLGAAWRLQQLGYTDWHLLEESSTLGGLAQSIVDAQGFTWDLGGHVLFSHYSYFDALMNELLHDDWSQHKREAWVLYKGRLIPYPLQNNIWRLPYREAWRSFYGLLRSHRTHTDSSQPTTLEAWLLQHFGRGLCDIFLLPYNRKVWAYDAASLSCVWIQERVATVDFKRLVLNALLRRDDRTWGPNAFFRFPLRGGTGAIWKALGCRLPSKQVLLRCPVQTIDASTRQIHLRDGSTMSYNRLISTMPRDRLLAKIDDAPGLRERAGAFKYSSTHCVGIGLQGKAPLILQSKCWIYFSEKQIPFYRATVFSNYSPFNVPRPGEQWSLLCEISESSQSPVVSETLVEDVIRSLKKIGFITESDVILSRWHQRLEYGYPTPFLGRDELLRDTDQHLQALGIWSRGRFGGWKYEASNQDHSFMQGVEAVDHFIEQKPETTYAHPQIANIALKR